MVTIGIRADRYKADVPTVTAPVRRRGPIHAAEARFARAATRRELKLTIPGPMTIVDTIHDAHYRSRARLGMELAALINDEARELEAAGVDMIQLDEPAFNVYMDEVRDWGIAALDRAVAGLGCRTAIHICYGYGIKAQHRLEADARERVAPVRADLSLLARSRVGGVSLECRNSRVPIELVSLLGDKDVHVGAIDVAATEEVETRPRSPASSAPRWRTCRQAASTRRRIAGWCLSAARSPARSSARVRSRRGAGPRRARHLTAPEPAMSQIKYADQRRTTLADAPVIHGWPRGRRRGCRRPGRRPGAVGVGRVAVMRLRLADVR